MKRERIAIIGSGISGMASAWFLHQDHDVTVFEKDDRIGGHSNTVMISEKDRQVPIDTGFMVYNEVTYPLLTKLFSHLGVVTKPTAMSFSVRHDADGIEFNGGSFNLLFGQRRNLLNFRYWKMLMQINRFNRETGEELENPKYGSITLRDYVNARGYGEDFLNWYLSPMAAAVWSSPPERVDDFPAHTLMRFWHNHGFLGLDTQHPWRTVEGGSRNYVAKLTWPFEAAIHHNAGVIGVSTVPGSGVRLRFVDDTYQNFDRVVIAAHSDQAAALLEDPDDLERELLSCFRYQKNSAILHTDPKFMPHTKRCWASWNYRIDRDSEGRNCYSTHYWMNELQGVSDHEQYFVSINPPGEIHDEHVKQRLCYEHPLFDLKSIAAQERLPELHKAGDRSGRYFCGAWQRYGFHEDGLLSAVNVCTQILGRNPWP